MTFPADVTVVCHHRGLRLRGNELLSKVYVYSMAGMNWLRKLT